MKKLFALFCLFPLLIACNNKSATENKLVLNLEEGKTYVMKQSTEMGMDQTVQGQDVHMDMVYDGNMEFNVLDVNNDIFTLEVTYTRMHMNMKNAFMNMDIDTDVEGNDSADVFTGYMGRILKNMIGESFNIKMDNHGNIKEVTGFEKIFSAAFAAIDKPMDEQTKASVRSQLESAYGEDALKSSLEMYMNIYPEQNVNTNDTWKKEVKLHGVVTGIYDVEYKLKGEENDMYLLSGKGTMSTEKAEYKRMNGMEMKYDMNGTFTSDMKVSKTSGWIEEATIKQDLDGNVDVKPNEQLPDGMKLPLKMTSKTTIN